MNVMEELRDTVSQRFRPEEAEEIRAAFNSLTSLGGTKESVVTELSNSRMLFVSDSYEMYITALPDERCPEMDVGVVTILGNGESLTDKDRIADIVLKAEKDRWTDYTIKTDKSLYYIRYGNIAGHW